MSSSPALQCGLSGRILEVLGKGGFERPLPIQAQALPVIMSGRDCIGIAKTGSGGWRGGQMPRWCYCSPQWGYCLRVLLSLGYLGSRSKLCCRPGPLDFAGRAAPHAACAGPWQLLH